MLVYKGYKSRGWKGKGEGCIEHKVYVCLNEVHKVPNPTKSARSEPANGVS